MFEAQVIYKAALLTVSLLLFGNIIVMIMYEQESWKNAWKRMFKNTLLSLLGVGVFLFLIFRISK